MHKFLDKYYSVISKQLLTTILDVLGTSNVLCNWFFKFIVTLLFSQNHLSKYLILIVINLILFIGQLMIPSLQRHDTWLGRQALELVVHIIFLSTQKDSLYISMSYVSVNKVSYNSYMCFLN